VDRVVPDDIHTLSTKKWGKESFLIETPHASYWELNGNASEDVN